MVGKENVEITSAFVGQHPGLFSTSPIYLFMSGPQEAVLQVQLNEHFEVDLEELKDDFRKRIKATIPGLETFF